LPDLVWNRKYRQRFCMLQLLIPLSHPWRWPYQPQPGSSQHTSTSLTGSLSSH
jgi:hypothetical protein